MHGLGRNIRYAFRHFSRSPVLVASVLLSIGLGIAVNATIFAVISRFVLKPAPVGDPSTLLALHTTHDGDVCCNNFSWPLYEDVRDHARSFSGVAAYYELLPASIGGAGEPERVWGQSATANYFDVAQLRMAAGRGFLASEEKQPVVVLGYRLWQRRFGADAAIVGKAVTLSGKPFTVVGVAPRNFHGLDQILDPQFWIPLGQLGQLAPSVPDSTMRAWHWLAVVGRLRPGVTETQAGAEMRTLAGNFAKAYPATDKGGGFLMERASSLPPRDKGTVLLFLGALAVAVLLVLGIACANVSNLLLAQAAARQREMAVRISLGATRAELLHQMLLESVLLALGGGLLGAVLSVAGTYALSSVHFPAPVPLDLSVSVDGRVLLYSLVLSVSAGLVFGLAPAWWASRPALASALRGEDPLARPGRRLHLRHVLVVAQVAMSVVLLCGTGLFLRSLEDAAGIDIGFRSKGVLMVSVDPRIHGYGPDATARFIDQLRERVRALPGVISVAATDSLPLSGGHRSDGFTVVGRKTDRVPPSVDEYMATPGYFRTLGIPLLAGRDFARETASGTKVALVNRALVERLFGTENPIGRQVTGGGATYQIIGVVGNIQSRTLGEQTRPVLFRSLAQTTGSDPSFLGYTLIVRSAGDPAGITQAIRSGVHTLDPAMAVYNVETIEDHLRSALLLPRLAAALFGFFGVIGLSLAAVGLYGVVSYTVSRRMRDIAIRLALGAPLGAVRKLILNGGMGMTAAALAIGMPAAWALARFASSFLYGVRPHDPATFVLVPVFLAAVAGVACWVPARRAVRVNVQGLLRTE